jgi:hypothetical protein
MRILLMCEGQNEEVLLNILLNAEALNFTRDDLIGRRPYPIRQLSNPTIKTELKHYGAPVKVYRVGDKQNDKLTIPRDLKNIVSKDEIYKYCTKPELEMLLILNEGLEREYEKVKSSESPKSFAKKNIKYNGRKYDQSSDFLDSYYGGNNTQNLIDNIKKYKTYKRQHEKDELYLADLLNK